MKVLTLISLISLLFSCTHQKINERTLSSYESSGEISNLLKKRFYHDYLLDKKTAKSFFIHEIPEYLKNQNQDGSFKDIDYLLDDNKFTPGMHPARMDYLAKAYKSPHHIYFNKPELKDAILKAFDFWTSKDIKSYNWWNNTIGVPQRFARVMILLEEELGLVRINKGIKILEKSHISKTGQNRLWYSEIVFIRSLFDGDTEKLKTASQEFYNLISVSEGVNKEEGMQVDMSFHQHGPLIYNGGYGQKFSLIVARLINILNKTPYQFPKSKIELYSRYVLEGQIWMTRFDKWDYSVTGREITRKNKNADLLKKVCEILKEIDLPRKKEFLNCYHSLANKRAYLVGHKAFWRSDYMVHHEKDYFSSVRMYSNRLINNDAPSNSEGLMSHYLADGATFIMLRADEYENIFPVWDWNMIPGTTTEVKKLKPAFYEPGNWDAFKHIRYFGKSKFVGVVSTKDVGMATMDFVSNKEFENLDLRKTYFQLKEGLFVYGDKVNCRGCKKVVSTIDQKLLNGDIYILKSNNKIIKLKKNTKLKNIKAVYHDNIVYYFPKEEEIQIENSIQRGSWSIINGQYDNEIIEKRVFKLSIINNFNSENSSFQYIILPNKRLDSIKEFELSKMASSSKTHHLSNKKYEMISFYQKDELDISGIKIKVNRPCGLILDKVTKKLYLSDPSQKYKDLKLSIDQKKYEVVLPQKAQKGKTIVVDL